MPLLLVEPDQDVVVALPVEPQVVDALVAHCQRGDEARIGRVAHRLAQAIAPVVEMYIDWDLRPPTKAQIHYAVALARTHGVELPADVLRQRQAMGKFLDQYAKAKAEVK